MANKKVPEIIAGVTLHPLARERTNALLRRLEDEGAAGVSTPLLSMIDRFRLLASGLFRRIDGENVNTTPPPLPDELQSPDEDNGIYNSKTTDLDD